MNTTKLKNKLIKLSLVFSLVFLLGINGVKAASAYTMTKSESNSTDILNNRSRKNSDYEDIIVCSYGCTSDNIGTNGGKCGFENSNFSTISYKIKNDKIIKWQIEMNMYQEIIRNWQDGGNTIDNLNFLWTSNSIPYTGIYFESPINNGNVNENWNNTKAYESLNNSFTCPQYLYYDTSIGTLNSSDFKIKRNGWGKADDELVLKVSNNMELCYANDKGVCATRAEKDKTEFRKENNLKYSFVEELGTILDNVNNDIIAIDSSTFLSRYYDEKDLCNSIKINSGIDFTDSLGNEQMINFINESLKKYSENSINKSIYSYEILTKLNEEITNLSYEGRSINEKYNNLNINYKNKFDESYDYYLKKCEVPDDVANIKKEEASETMTAKITKNVKKIIDDFDEIDDSPLDCNNLFSGLADLISGAYSLIEIGAILIVIVLSVLDYTKIFLADNQDAMKKANQNLIKRIIILVIILLLPALVNLILRIFHIEGFNSENPLCVEIKK